MSQAVVVTQAKSLMSNINTIGAGGAALAVLIILLILMGSWYTVDQTQRGVLLRNGAFVEVVQPGLHFKWPVIDNVVKIDMQTTPIRGPR